jgi:excisionase family DNA binding protein
VRAISEDYVTVDEAAKLLRVAPSTVRRWIREGDLPAFRVGRRRVALKQSDLASLIAPVRSAEDEQRIMTEDEVIKGRRLTPEEIERGLATLERVEQINREMLARRGGKPFPPSWEILNEMRDERTRQLS